MKKDSITRLRHYYHTIHITYYFFIFLMITASGRGLEPSGFHGGSTSTLPNNDNNNNNHQRRRPLTSRSSFSWNLSPLVFATVAALCLIQIWMSYNYLTTIFAATNSHHGVSIAQKNKSSDICTENPYMLSLNETFDDLERVAKIWLANSSQHLLRAADDRYNAHDHQRFFPFESMGRCNDISCVGGKCSADTSKITCGMSHLSRLDSCIVYSIGGNNQWEFELDILKRTNCDVHTFDCTGALERFKVPENNRLHFHHICLGANRSSGPLANGNGETWTLADIQSHFSHKRVDLLKVDIEGWEWPIFDRDAPPDLNLPMQLLMEVHYCVRVQGRRNPFLECKVLHNHTLETASDMVRFQSHLLRNGYVVVNKDDNPHCAHCTELTLMRVRC